MANAKPHTHAMEVRRSNYESHVIVLNYGDQQKKVWERVPGFKGRTKRKMKRMIKRHDRMSVKTAVPLIHAEELAKQINAAALTKEITTNSYSDRIYERISTKEVWLKNLKPWKHKHDQEVHMTTEAQLILDKKKGNAA